MTRITQTSRAAAAAIAPRAASQRRRVYDLIRERGPLTREAIGEALGLSVQSATPRVHELITAGHVRVVDDAGRTKTGRKAERLMATAKPYSDTPTTPPVQRLLPLQP